MVHLKEMSIFATTVDAGITSCLPFKERAISNQSVDGAVPYGSSSSDGNGSGGGSSSSSSSSSSSNRSPPSDRVFQSTHFNTDIFRTISSYDTGIEQISTPPALIVAG